MQGYMQKNTEISERLLQIIESEGINANKYAKKLGYKRSQTLYDAINKGIFGLELLQRIAENSVNVNWLLTGTGDSYINLEGGESSLPIKESNKIELLKELLDEQTEKTLKFKKQLDEIMGEGKDSSKQNCA